MTEFLSPHLRLLLETRSAVGDFNCSRTTPFCPASPQVCIPLLAIHGANLGSGDGLNRGKATVVLQGRGSKAQLASSFTFFWGKSCSPSVFGTWLLGNALFRVDPNPSPARACSWSQQRAFSLQVRSEFALSDCTCDKILTCLCVTLQFLD